MTVWSRASRPLRSLPLAVLLAIVSGLKNISIKIRRSLVGESLDFSIAIEILSALRKTPIPATSSTSFTSPYKRCIYICIWVDWWNWIESWTFIAYSESFMPLVKQTSGNYYHAVDLYSALSTIEYSYSWWGYITLVNFAIYVYVFV